MGLRALMEHQVLQFIEKGLDILEVPVDRGEAHVGDLIELLQLLHEHFSYISSRKLAVKAVSQPAFDRIHYFGQLGHGDRPLFTGFEQPGKDLLPVEFLASAVLLDHHVGDLVAALVGGEAALAFFALPAPPDDIAFLALPRIDHAILFVAAEGAGHRVASAGRCRSLLQWTPSWKAQAKPTGTTTTNVTIQMKRATPVDRKSTRLKS